MRERINHPTLRVETERERGREEEKAHEFVSVGVKNNIFSHVCWHVYGLLHKADRKLQRSVEVLLASAED